ncbi:aromatic-ring-hydroxylating dioxygenase subunit beta [Neobacillus sp. CF12]|uniref:aromatic-ring-hydroxylating dioxygenase subunit beta n=1 Tax=Neobacillus sp. CF12 TaxID=3055864 RepID=UPI0025A0E2B8|nr:aromatic-ring-hydroxylating dioxygenase subunit beta [Neobacillus sp. CF12]MDM5331695.1 aromatic-ring-hydroxylating dioxygenase subunit beta [Neobacillus sp. CF12]
MKVPFDFYQEGIEFFLNEAELIDDGRFRDWLELMTDDFTYRIPVRVTREKAAPSEFSDLASHMDETKNTMEIRILRAYSEYNWAEDPASRTRHFLTNFRAKMDQEVDNEIHFKTNFLLYRGKFDSPTFQFLSGERHDTIRRIDGEWKISKRLILLDHATIPMNNLAIFI